jgi:two-component system cell cycle sensor histidine kinase/response regulator CckA
MSESEAEETRIKSTLDLKSRVASLLDITEFKRTEDALRRSEESAKRLAQENLSIAEIGRIISSTLRIEEVYELFAEEVQKLIPFDRISINTVNHSDRTVTNTYSAGSRLTYYPDGKVIPFEDSIYQNLAPKRSAILVQPMDESDLQTRYPALLPVFQAGFRSMISVPLVAKDQIVGLLHLRSVTPHAYTDADLLLAEKVGREIAGAIANAQLYAERIQAQKALQESEQRYRALAESAQDFIFILDREGNVEYVNSFGAATFGCRQEELIGRNVVEIFPSENSDRQLQRIREVFESGTTLRVDHKATFPNLKLWLNTQIIPLRNEHGEMTSVLGVSRDITERKRAEEEMAALQEQLRQSQKMEAIGRLAGGIAHDFNNILTVIRGYSELSLMNLKESDPLKTNLAEIQKAAGRASDLTRQLLAFSRRQILEMKLINLNLLVKDLDKMLRRVISEDIELVTLLAPELESVRADPGQIEQAILNLAVNARDAMPHGGKLIIETANADLDEVYTHTHMGVTPGHYVTFSVSDTGCGMTPEVRERVFEPFFTTKEQGTGLGLSTVYGIVKQIGGSIWLYSEPGQGTTFKIYLPRVAEKADGIPRRNYSTDLPAGSETILLVEDEPSVRDLASRILRGQGYTVMEAANGHEAMQLLQDQTKKTIHLLFTDMVMPRMGGKELAERLKNLLPDIKILFTSGYTDGAIVHRGVLHPGTHFLQKPFTPVVLARKVREVLDS